MALHTMKSSNNDDIFDKTGATKPLSKTKMPEKESDPKTMYQLIKDELMLDGNSRQNLATFCQTFVDDEIHRLIILPFHRCVSERARYGVCNQRWEANDVGSDCSLPLISLACSSQHSCPRENKADRKP